MWTSKEQKVFNVNDQKNWNFHVIFANSKLLIAPKRSIRFISRSALILEIFMIRNRPDCPIKRPTHRTSSPGITTKTTKHTQTIEINLIDMNDSSMMNLRPRLKIREKEMTLLVRTTLNRLNGIAKVVGFHFKAWLLFFRQISQGQLIRSHFWVFWQRWNALDRGWKW